MVSRAAVAVLILASLFLLAAGGRGPQKGPEKGINQSAHGRASRAALDPESTRLNNLGAAYANQQDFRKAAQMFQKAAELEPRWPVPRLNEAIALMNLQKEDDAESLLLKVTREQPGDVRAWYNLGLLYKNKGEAAEALHAFEQVIAQHPQDADSYYFLGVALSQMHRDREAMVPLKKALQLNPFHASAEFALAKSYRAMGEGAEAALHFQRFQHLSQTKTGTLIAQVYGDQGPLSLAVTHASSNFPVPPEIPARFTQVTSDAGMTYPIPLGSSSKSAPTWGPGACWFDYDEDGAPDLLMTANGRSGGIILLRNAGGKFEDVTEKAKLDPGLRANACAAGDYDNDGHTDLALATEHGVVLLRNTGHKTFEERTNGVNINAPQNALLVLFFDYDHDGDLDLFVSGGTEDAKNHLWRNNGNATFTDVTREVAMGVPAQIMAAAPTDADNDRAIDLSTGSKSGLNLFVNPREGAFQSRSIAMGAAAPRVNSIAVLDFNKDGWMDQAVTLDSAPGIMLLRNKNGRFRPVSMPRLGWDKAWGIAATDYDNDGWLDLVAVGERARDKTFEVRMLRNQGPQGFADVTSKLGLQNVKLQSPRSVSAVDYDNDGDLDLLVTQADKGPVLLRNDGGNRRHAVRLALTGHSDNKSAVGTKIEVFAGPTSQKYEITGIGYMSQSALPLLAGLGTAAQADVVRILWPSGVLQDEIQIAAGAKPITEIDRRGSSCPILFVWDGSRYRFVSDMIGAGVVGHWIAPGQRNVPDPTEYLKVEGFEPKLRDGLISTRFMEPMEEVVYLDQIKMLAVDHPADFAVYPNEFFASSPPYVPFSLISARDPQSPAGAWDDKGNNVLPLLLDRDHKYVQGFELLPIAGFTKMHSLEIDLGEPYDSGPLRLLLHGYIEYFTATSMYAAHQSGLDPVAPFVEALTPSGRWVRVLDDMGFPAGLPRTMVADLSGKLPHGARRIRITTNLQIYWDQLRISRSAQEKQIRLTELPLVQASLDFHGFPLAIEGSTPGDLDYRYETVSRSGPYTRPEGAYTRTGDVRPLLRSGDDRQVVFGSGDEVQADFDPAGLPPLPVGWKRDYIFFALGYEKDMDFYAADGSTVLPLPFSGLSGYPYPRDEVVPAKMRDDILQYNDRFFTGDPTTLYRFNFVPAGGSR